MPTTDMTSLVKAEFGLRLADLTNGEQQILLGPRTQAQRLAELDLVLTCARSAAATLVEMGYPHGIVIISMTGTELTLVPYAEIPMVFPGLPAEARELLAMAEQICAHEYTAIVGLLLPDNHVKLLYFAEDSIRGMTYPYGA